MRELEKYLPSNCFSITRFGDPVEGITLSMERGPNQLRPWEPHVTIGGWHVNRDRNNGCVYTPSHCGASATVLRACTKEIFSEKRAHHTLVKPADVPTHALFNAHTDVKNMRALVANGRELHLFTGVSGGKVIKQSGYQVLVEVLSGSPLFVFYKDGMVRKFIFDGATLSEEHLTNDAMLTARIARAWYEMERATMIEDGMKQEKVFRAILLGMVDLLQLSTVFGHQVGMEMRLRILREFFLELAPEMFALVERVLAAVLYQVDPVLVHVMYGNESAGLPDKVANIATARMKRDKAKEEAAKAARRAERVAAQPKKGPGGQKLTHASNPDKIARRERKVAQRK